MTQRPAEAGSLQQQQEERLEQVLGNTKDTGLSNSFSIPPAAVTTSDAGSEKKLKKLVEQQSLQIQQLNEIREQEVEAKSQELQVALEELQVRNEEIEKLEAALMAASEELETVKKELEERRQLYPLQKYLKISKSYNQRLRLHLIQNSHLQTSRLLNLTNIHGRYQLHCPRTRRMNL